MNRKLQIRTMSSQRLTVAVPDEVLARIRDRARQANRTVEAEVVNLLTDATCAEEALPADIEAAIAALGLLDESALRIAAESRLSKKESTRLAALHYKRQKDGLTRAEDKERRTLVHRYEKAMVIRATALAELHKRGVDVAEFIAP
jgi:plasmid stability protein